MEPEPPSEQSPTTPDDQISSAPSQQPPALRPWEVPFAQSATPQQGQPAWPPPGVAATPARRSHIGLIIGVIAVVLVVGVIAAGIVAFLLLRDTVTSATKARTSASSSTPTATPATVVLDGQPLTIRSQPSCIQSAGSGEILISVDASQGIAVTLNGNPPQVDSMSLGTINGVAFTYVPGLDDTSPVATRDGNTFKISGTASGIEDWSNPLQRVHKPFEIDVTCPQL
jgi:ipoprotein LpqH